MLLKSIDFFSIKNLKIISNDSQIENLIDKEFSLKNQQEGSYDLIYLDFPRADILTIYEDKIHNDSLILIKDIHKNKSATLIWEKLNRDKLITVSLDMFYCGLLFFRKEQVKEHFKIRI